MVRALIMALLLLPCVVQAITPEALRALAEQADNEAREKSARVNNGDLTRLLPQDQVRTKEKSERPMLKPVSRKYAKPGAEKVKGDIVRDRTEQKTQSPVVSVRPEPVVKPRVLAAYEYVPPPRSVNARASHIVSDAVTLQAKNKFGISTGTWLDAEISRDVNSAEPGPIEIRLKTGHSGNHRTLPVGTTFLASKEFNMATQRLEMMAFKGITPKGVEFEFNAQIHDENKVSGLSGLVKKRQVIEGGLQRGLVASGRAMIASITGSSVMAAGIDAAAGTVLNEGDQRANKRLKAGRLIYVSRQSVRLFVLSSF